MTMIVPNPNVLLAIDEDKAGHVLIELKDQLVATGLWRVRGSGTGGTGGTFQLMGQTAGVGGSYDVFTASPPYITTGGNTWWTGGAGSISRTSAWLVLEEIGTGRCFTFTRMAGQNAGYMAYVGIRLSFGVASSGASATAAPAATAPSAILWDGNNSWSGDFTNPTYAHWLQIGLADAAEAGGTCPFWLSLFNKTVGTKSFGMIYESLVDTVPGNAHPFIAMANAWGTVFNNSFGLFYWYGGPTLSNYGLSGYHNVGGTMDRIPHSNPAMYTQGLGSDGNWRTFRPLVIDGAQAIVGRCKNLLFHPINRDYPTTYKVASPDAKLALGQFLVPWKQGVAPQANP